MSDCDHVIGEITERDDYHYCLGDLVLSTVVSEGWSDVVKEHRSSREHLFIPHNFCHECGQDVREHSAKAEQELQRHYGKWILPKR